MSSKNGNFNSSKNNFRNQNHNNKSHNGGFGKKISKNINNNKKNDAQNADKSKACYMSKNMNYAFQVEYLGQAVDGQISNENLLKVINQQKEYITAWGKQHVNELKGLEESEKSKEVQSSTVQTLSFKTQYPGALIGTGYPHETGKSEGEIQVGFSFDYVTGAPYYPGSSLKGVIRNVFDNAIHGDEKKLYLCYISDILEEAGHSDVSEAEKNLKGFVEYTFGNENKSKEVIAGTDIFYGGFVVGGPNNIIGLDSLTPHGTDLTKNPIPITMLRIMPDVEITFVIDTRSNAELDKMGFTGEVRCKLYRKILEDFGIGAKRNVGYGNLTLIKSNS